VSEISGNHHGPASTSRLNQLAEKGYVPAIKSIPVCQSDCFQRAQVVDTNQNPFHFDDPLSWFNKQKGTF
jgi:hypothetical protein